MFNGKMFSLEILFESHIFHQKFTSFLQKVLVEKFYDLRFFGKNYINFYKKYDFSVKIFL